MRHVHHMHSQAPPSLGLPDEALMHVFRHLTCEDLIRCSEVNWAMHSLSSDDHLWREVYLSTWGRSLVRSNQAWKQQYKQQVLQEIEGETSKLKETRYMRKLVVEKYIMSLFGMMVVTTFVGASLPSHPDIGPMHVCFITSILGMFFGLVSLFQPDTTARFYGIMRPRSGFAPPPGPPFVPGSGRGKSRRHLAASSAHLVSPRVFTTILVLFVWAGCVCGGYAGKSTYHVAYTAMSFMLDRPTLFALVVACVTIPLVRIESGAGKVLGFLGLLSCMIAVLAGGLPAAGLYPSHDRPIVGSLSFGLVLGGCMGLVLSGFKYQLAARSRSVVHVPIRIVFLVLLWTAAAGMVCALCWAAGTVVVITMTASVGPDLNEMPLGTSLAQYASAITWTLGSCLLSVLAQVLFASRRRLVTARQVFGDVALCGCITLLVELISALRYVRFVLRALVGISLCVVCLPWMASIVYTSSVSILRQALGLINLPPPLGARRARSFLGLGGVEHNTLLLLFWCGAILGTFVGLGDAVLLGLARSRGPSVPDDVEGSWRAIRSVADMVVVGGGFGCQLLAMTGDPFLDSRGPF
eukprot:TRINITY_DN16280_c0_g2_i3.p1 TRINITY_DN16280_c0_g2~~TRINITY_DN16280_c0_g2_i3.p1  ORF type:complete len:580 (-),score=96.45 TRINITY_DN16280_c0_g2_i3:474-2213(-)